jgi:hypothetical protein
MQVHSFQRLITKFLGNAGYLKSDQTYALYASVKDSDEKLSNLRNIERDVKMYTTYFTAEKYCLHFFHFLTRKISY